MPGATSCFPSVALGQVEMWRIVMGPQEGTEHTQLLTVGQLRKSPMPETAVPQQPGHQEKEASLASLLRSQPCGRKDFIGRDIARPHARRAGSSLVPDSPAHFVLFLLCTHIPVNTSILLHFPKCLSLDLGMVVYLCHPSYSGSKDRRAVISRPSWAA